MTTTLRMAAVALTLSGLGLTACGGDRTQRPTPAYEVVQPRVFPAGAAIPAPAGEVVLTVSGDVAGGRATFDLDTLEEIGTVSYSVDDEQAEGTVAEFEGVLLGDLLDAVGADTGATSLRMTALNDYAIDVPIEDALARRRPVGDRRQRREHSGTGCAGE